MRIVIVEDEIRIREGLAKLISKIDPKYRVVGEAEDGAAGLRIIEAKRPDLVITDVRMRDIDGLQMLAKLREQGVRTRAIVLSAYSEFAYARAAIKLGVSEYLLKPIAVGDLSRALKNEEDQMAAELAARPASGSRSLESALYAALTGDGPFGDGPFGDGPFADVGGTLGDENRGFDAAGRFALVSLYIGTKYPTDGPKITGNIKALLARRTESEYRILELPKAEKLAIFLYGFDAVGTLQHWFGTNFLPELRRTGLKDFGCAWISFTGLSGFRTAMLQLDACLDWNLVLGDGTMIIYPEVEETPSVPLSYPIMIENQVRSALCARDRDRFGSGIDEFLRYLHSDKTYSPKEIKESTIRFFWAVLNVAREVAYDQYEALPQQRMLEKISFAVTWSELQSAAAILLRLAPETPAGVPDDGAIINRTKNLVHEYYSQGITLDEIASKLNVTPEYLSALFHRAAGVNFSAYIKDHRIQKAKELLIGTELKLYAVGEKVGYKDAKYFGRVFKEATGLSPSDYRMANR